MCIYVYIYIWTLGASGFLVKDRDQDKLLQFGVSYEGYSHNLEYSLMKGFWSPWVGLSGGAPAPPQKVSDLVTQINSTLTLHPKVV